MRFVHWCVLTNPPFSRGILAVLFIVSILWRNEFRLQRNDLIISWRYDYRCNNRMGIGNGPVLMLFFATVFTTNFFDEKYWVPSKAHNKLPLNERNGSKCPELSKPLKIYENTGNTQEGDTASIKSLM